MSSEVLSTSVGSEQHAFWGRRRRANMTPYLFVSPAVLCLVVFGALPIVVAAAVSLTDLNITGLANTTNHFKNLVCCHTS